MKILSCLIGLVLCVAHAQALPVSIVSHHWVSKVTDTRNSVSIRPGSVYEIQTYFEAIFDGGKPKFKYIFKDTGLGTADPIYPIFQRGYQESWGQLLPAIWTDKKRHIDHYSVVDTPEGCKVYSAYWVRHIDEFPDRWHKERAEGYTLVDIGFDYYESEQPNTVCGKHRAFLKNDQEPNPIEQLKQYANDFKQFDDIPDAILAKLEAKQALLKLIDEEFNRNKWPRYDQVYSLEDNSMWYYQTATDEYYGKNQELHKPVFNNINQVSDLLVETNDLLKTNLTLETLITENEFQKLLNHLNGKPENQVNLSNEPGNDEFSLTQINDKHIYTQGLDLWKIKNIQNTVANSDNYQFVSMIIRPYERVIDKSGIKKIIPQMRFVFQLKDPIEDKLTEQLFLHIVFDGADRNLNGIHLRKQHKDFLTAYNNSNNNPDRLFDFIQQYKQNGAQSINYSSSLTGIWVFGSLSKNYQHGNQLKAATIERQGINLGYYSTVWDSEIFRSAEKSSNGQAKRNLTRYLERITPKHYRDPRRHNAEDIRFNEVTCAGCHHMSGRDGVHIAMNDKLDQHSTRATRSTEFMINELARQLEFGQTFW